MAGTALRRMIRFVDLGVAPWSRNTFVGGEDRPIDAGMEISIPSSERFLVLSTSRQVWPVGIPLRENGQVYLDCVTRTVICRVAPDDLDELDIGTARDDSKPAQIIDVRGFECGAKLSVRTSVRISCSGQFIDLMTLREIRELRDAAQAAIDAAEAQAHKDKVAHAALLISPAEQG